ncbi:hypothetical protein GCK72_017284 [Caenorhabditis remanei]|uniref:Sex-determining region Y protein n=1 Tax=Caenorhabditis remanei TaxID=31234 RepID=A0A6A5G7H1_CAERE|nr:hypothetical protein GCK72_017284 [Caenorhabditis remanei]KAF1750733.1 hypothetical protein GCK72_017284 [Caenorhabditis remanei]
MLHNENSDFGLLLTNNDDEEAEREMAQSVQPADALKETQMLLSAGNPNIEALLNSPEWKLVFSMLQERLSQTTTNLSTLPPTTPALATPPPVPFSPLTCLPSPFSFGTHYGNEGKKDHVKRPLNAFMIWSRQERRKITDSYPDCHNSTISKLLGQRWKEMRDDQKKPYFDEQEHLKELHKQEYPDYRYKPSRRRISIDGKKVPLSRLRKGSQSWDQESPLSVTELASRVLLLSNQQQELQKSNE